MSLIELERDQRNNPLEVVEHMATGNNWPFERSGEDEIALLVTGRWTEYQLSFTWTREIEALHLACAFDMKVPELRLVEVQQLVALINEQLWIGHFDVWMQNGMVMFRHALVLAGGVAASGRQCEAVLASALDACDAITRRSSSWSGRQIRARGDGLRDVRIVRRGVTLSGSGRSGTQAPVTNIVCLSCRRRAGCSLLGAFSWRLNGTAMGPP